MCYIKLTEYAYWKVAVSKICFILLMSKVQTNKKLKYCMLVMNSKCINYINSIYPHNILHFIE